MRKCKHKSTTYTVASVYVEQTETRTPLVVGQLRCDKCRAIVPLGHSDETPVAVEVRAAEIAADGANPHDLFRNDKPSWFGWCQHVAATHSGDDEANCLPHEEAGWLAREIATHSDGGIE